MDNDRLLGAKYLISTGTALIFETKEFDITKWPDLIYINLRTLYRNYVQSYPLDKRTRIKEKEFIEIFLQEVSEVERIIREVSNNRVTPFFYYPTYKSLKKLLPYTELKEYNPNGFDEVEVNLWKYVKKHELVTPFLYEEIDSELPKANKEILLLSSFVSDLLSSSNFHKLSLIESFTGKIKTRDKWSSKLRIKTTENYNNLNAPFNRFTIQIFGDKSGALQGADIKLRKVVRQMAIENHWTPVTTMDKVKNSIMKLKDTKLKELLFKYL